MMATYMAVARALLDRIDETQTANIEGAAALFANSIAGEGFVHVFGSGHSRMCAEELFPRIGSYVGYHPIAELSLSNFTNVVGSNGIGQAFFLERVDGFAETILRSHHFEAPDCALVVSSSGVNSVPVEFAWGLKRRGIPVVCITSIAHSSSTRPKNSLGKRLYEISDIAIDSCVPYGDAAVQIDGLDRPVGALSTLASIAIVQCLNVRTAEILAARGVALTIMTNPHIDDEVSMARNRSEYLEAYRRRLSRRNR